MQGADRLRLAQARATTARTAPASLRSSSTLLATRITGRSLRRRMRAAARSVSVAPTVLSTTRTMTSAVSIAYWACRVIEAPRPVAFGSQPPVSTTVNRLPFQSAS